MYIAILFSFLSWIFFAILLYFVYQIAYRQFTAKQHLLSRRIRSQNKIIQDLSDKFSALVISAEKHENGKEKTAGTFNNFDRSELRHVEAIKENEIVVVNGKPVRKNEVFKTK